MYVSTSTGVRTGCHYLISLSVRLSNDSLCMSVRVTFVIFTDCESCTRPIPTNPASVEADEYVGSSVPSRGGRVAGLLWIQWFVWGGADFVVLSMSLHFQIHS